MALSRRNSSRAPWEWRLTFAHQVKQWVEKGMCEACAINAVAATWNVDYVTVEIAYMRAKESDE